MLSLPRVALLLVFAFSDVSARVWQVDANAVEEHIAYASSGPSTASVVRTIQAAVNLAKPGDTILVAPGVYHEHITIPATIRGTAEAPITLRAAAGAPVIITGADRDFRSGRNSWDLVDPTTRLYSAPHAEGWPARVLYDNIDLYPYASLEALTSFQNKTGPGPLHGYFYNEGEQRLYLRLHPQRSAEGHPSGHVIAIAPPTGSGFEGSIVTRPEHYGIGVLGKGPAHIVIDGFTFETPGVAGVYVEADDVLIQNARFFGCRTAVAGNYQETIIDPEKGYAFRNLRHDPTILDEVAARIVLRRCFFTQYPAFEDIGDCIARLPEKTPAGREGVAMLRAAMWHRKSIGNGLPSELFKYEIGIAARIGRDWVIEDSKVIDAFEGLSCHSVAGSENLVVRRNLFARIADNALETEDWAQGLVATENVMLDVMEPFSWQPGRGTPWPTNIVFARNVIANTPKFAGYWSRVLPGRGAFKIGASTSNWSQVAHMVDTPRSPITLGGDGVEIHRNLVYFPGGRLFTLIGDRQVPLPEFKFHDNLFAVDRLYATEAKRQMAPGHFTFARNTSVTLGADLPDAAAIAAGTNGVQSEASALDFRDVGSLDLRPKSEDRSYPWPTPDLRAAVRATAHPELH